MRHYKITFTDGTSTTGKAESNAKMRVAARRYIRSWDLDIKVASVKEIKEA